MKHIADTPPSVIALANIVPSPFQYRRTASEAGMAELAESIKRQGVLQPLLARPRTDADGMYELVFGHRRYSAAHAAGLESVPVIVAALSDEEARLAQIAENLERENVHPIEEGEAFQALITEHGRTREQIAEQYGKSLSYVTGRLKLLAAVPEVRKACLAGDIGSEIALLLARLRTPELQAKALGYIKGKFLDLEDGGKKSYRAVRELLEERFTLELKGAMFDTSDALLLPDAGACSTCPKLSGNAPEYQDLLQPREGHYGRRLKGDPNLCTDPDCWGAKVKAHLANKAAELEAKGKTVVTGAKARQAISATGEIKGDFIPLDKVREALKTAKGEKPEVVTIINPRDGKAHQVVKVEDLRAAGVKGVATKARHSTADAEAERKRREAEWQRDQEKCAEEQASRQRLLAAVRQRIADSPRNAYDLYLIAQAALAGVDYDEESLIAELWGFKSPEDLRKGLGQMPADQLTLLALDCALVDRVHVSGTYYLKDKPERLLAAAKHYGVDPSQASAKPADTPSGAARAPKKGGKAAKGKTAAAEPAQGELEVEGAGA